jgi:hypothetical protein
LIPADGDLVLRVVVQGAGYVGLELPDFGEAAAEDSARDERTHAITNSHFPKCVASTDAQNEGALRKRKPLYMRNLLSRKDMVVSLLFTNTFFGFR